MTVTTTTNKINAVGDGIQTNFPYNFKVTVATQMLVYLDNVLYGAAYTVNGVGNDAGGSVDIAVPPGIDVIVTLYRYVPEVQETDYEPYRAFPSETVENDMDLAVMRDQQLQEVDSRAVTAPINDDGSFDYTLPAVAAGKGIKANATGDGWVETTYDPDEAQTDSAANAAAALVSENAAAVSAAAALVSENAAAASAVLAAADAARMNGLNMIELEMGFWDMDATTSISVPHGLPYSKILGVALSITNDTETDKSVLPFWNPAASNMDAYVSSISATHVFVTRRLGGLFDHPDYDGVLPTLANRGSIVVLYKD